MFTCLGWEWKGKSRPFTFLFSDFYGARRERTIGNKDIPATEEEVLVMRQSPLNGEALKDGVAAS